MKNPKRILVLIPALLASCGEQPTHHVSASTDPFSSSQSESSSTLSSNEESSLLSSEESSYEESSILSNEESSSIESSSIVPPDYQPETIEKHEANVYLLSDANHLPGLTFDLYTINEDETLYYVDLMEFTALAQSIFEIDFDVIECDEGLIIYRNGETVTFDVVNNDIIISDFKTFFNRGDDPSDIASLVSDDPNGQYLYRTDSHYRKGYQEIYDLDRYDLKLYYDDDEYGYYVPGHILSEMFSYYINSGSMFDERGWLFNAIGKLIDQEGELTEAGEFFYRPKESVTKEFALANYNLLCLDMDMQYGLGYSHGMENGFDDWATRTGYKEKLTSTNPKEADIALAKAIFEGLDDVHITYSMPGEYSGYFDTGINPGPSRTKVLNTEWEMEELRDVDCPDLEPYMEYGDTAFVTFDSFRLAHRNHYNEGFVPTNTFDDTMELISYANGRIKREGSPIKNVVLDLACNGGGALDTAAFALAWMLGESKLCLDDPIGKSVSYVKHKADVNFDGVYDENDTIKDLNLYCIASGGSFSCGNLVPCVLKDSGKVTMLGQTSGGGSCAVLMRSTLGGSVYRISSRNELCVYKNGTYYPIDQGAEPHIYLRDELMFKRDYLVNNIIHK